MSDRHILADYEALKPTPRAAPSEDDALSFEKTADSATDGEVLSGAGSNKLTESLNENWNLRRGHLVSYVGLFLFTAFVFFRPYELFAVPGLDWGAQILALLTLAAYIPTQLSLEGNLTAKPREVKLALLLLLTAFLSIPLAISPGEAFENVIDFTKVILMFVILVNIVSTERRLNALLLLAMAVSIFLSFSAFQDFRSGTFKVGAVRVRGAIGGLFENPNDLALHLVTMVPIAIAFAFARRGIVRKTFYGLCASLFVSGVVVTFSRGGFLGLVAGAGVVAWKLGRKHRFVVSALTSLALIVFIAASPGGYGQRITSMVFGDATGSRDAREDLFWRSALVAARYPLSGVGLGCFYHKGQHNQVSHNSYTQVAAEMGLPALIIYMMFMVTSVRRLRQIEKESLRLKERSRYYYLSVGLQASLVAYMVTSFFASVAHLWYVYYLVGYAVCLRRFYSVTHGAFPAPEKATNANVHEDPQYAQNDVADVRHPSAL